MANKGFREEVFNVLLALLLNQRGVVTAPEQSLWQAVKKKRDIPDVIVDFRGLRTIIEGKVDDQAKAKGRVLEQVNERLENGIAHIGIAVLYPAELRNHSFDDLLDIMAKSSFEIVVCSEAGQTGWTEGDVNYLTDLLNRTFDQLVKEDVVAKAVDLLDEGVGNFAERVYTNEASIEKAAKILGIGELPKRKKRKESEDED